MATVRITDELRRKILGKAREAFDTALDPAPQEKRQLMAGKRLLDRYRKNPIDTKNYKVTTVKITSIEINEPICTNIGDEPPVMNLQNTKKVDVDLPESERFEAPTIGGLTRVSNYRMTDSTLFLASCGVKLQSPLDDDILIPLWEYNRDVTLANIKRDTAVRQIQQLLAETTTLKQFLAAWPQGKEVIPEAAMQKHYQKNPTRTKRVIEAGDTSNLSLTLAKNKMKGVIDS